MDDFQSADVIILQIYESPWKLWKEPTLRMQGLHSWINQEEDGDVNVGGESNTLTLSPHWLAPGHTGVTKSYRFKADGGAGLPSE